MVQSAVEQIYGLMYQVELKVCEGTYLFFSSEASAQTVI